MAFVVKKKPSSGKQPKPEINVTPLVDVVLVLLIIFMVVTPAIAEGEHIELPEIVNVDEKDREPPIDVTLAANGTIVVDKQPVADDAALAEILTSLYQAKPGRKVMLNADRKLDYGDVRARFKLIQDVGFQGVKLKVLQQQKEGA